MAIETKEQKCVVLPEPQKPATLQPACRSPRRLFVGRARTGVAEVQSLTDVVALAGRRARLSAMRERLASNFPDKVMLTESGQISNRTDRYTLLTQSNSLCVRQLTFSSRGGAGIAAALPPSSRGPG